MTLRQWLTFMAMAAVWHALGHVVLHYTELALRTYRARQSEIWFERNIRRHLQ